jgi:hypothetical protein
MHNKYCIIDSNTVITGSYNYTYFAESINQENIVIIKDNEDIINKYKENFNKLIFNKESILSIKKYLQENPYSPYLSVLDSFKITDVIYRQFKPDYNIDKIQVIEDDIIITFKTKATPGCWVHGSKAKFAWLIRNTKNHEESVVHYRITNIKINGEKIQHLCGMELKGEKICCFSNNKELKFKDNSRGYNLNEKGKPINEKGEEIPIIIVFVPNSFELSCEIHFKAKELINKTIDLIEGLGTDEKDNHWHCFEINMLLNRESL